MKVVLTAWLLIGGSWYHGSVVHGWWPFALQTEEACYAAIERIEREGLVAAPVGSEVVFTCETSEDSFRHIQEKHIPLEERPNVHPISD